jgi:hypothetical protein
VKIDIDSIFYIILSIIILAVSGLGRRRKKQNQPMKNPLPSSAQAGTREPRDMTFTRPRGPVDPFERLEQILTGQPQYQTLEGESLEDLEDEEQMIVDEEETYSAAAEPQQMEPGASLPAEKEGEQMKLGMLGLFQDLDEITRAIIYSEILPRKYF